MKRRLIALLAAVTLAAATALGAGAATGVVASPSTHSAVVSSGVHADGGCTGDCNWLL